MKDAVETEHLHVAKTTTTQPYETVNQIQHVDSSLLLQSLNMNSTTLCTLQKQDKFCKNKVCELHSGIHRKFYLNNDSILKQSVMINNLEVCMTVVPLAITNTLIHEFHNCRGHQGCARTLNACSKEDFGGKACEKTLSIILVIVLHALKIFLMFHVTLNCI